MANYKGHVFGGVVAYVLVAIVISSYCMCTKFIGNGFLFAIAGSLFPDVDIKSNAQKIFYALVFVSMLILAIQNKESLAVFLGMISFLPLFVKHRGLFHSFWFNFILTVLAISFICVNSPLNCTSTIYYAIFFLAGILSHLFLDRRN